MSEDYSANMAIDENSSEWEEWDDDNVQTRENDDQRRRYVAFVSDNLVYAISADYVTEIITNHIITMLPMVPNYISGIINLRGQIMPVVNIRLRMGKMPLETDTNCVVVLNVNSMAIGIQVDAVSQVLDIDESKISPMPSNNHEELVNGILNLPGGDTILFFDVGLLASGY